jgi:hypothetical protein
VTAIRSRLAKLEGASEGASGRVVAVMSNGANRQEVERHLAKQGIALAPADRLAHITLNRHQRSHGEPTRITLLSMRVRRG